MFASEVWQMKVVPALQSAVLALVLLTCGYAQGQSDPAPGATPAPAAQNGLKPRAATAPPPNGNLAIVNGRPYQKPTPRQQFTDYLRDSYGLPAQARNTVRALYSEGRDKPVEWGQDFPGFMQRYGAAAGTTAINGNVRYGMEIMFHEDLRYIPCQGCHVKRKIENALLAEITARHDSDGHRFFTLTPTIADFTGPIIAHSIYYPGGADPAAGAVSARLVFATRIGSHLFTEFVLERRHKDKPMDR